MTFQSPLQPVGLEVAVERERARARRSALVIAGYAWFCFAMLGFTFASVAHFGFVRSLKYGAIGGVIGGTFTVVVVRFVQWLTQRGMRAVLEPGGTGRETAVYSHAESLAVRGNLHAAAKVFDQARAEHGEKASLLRAEADVQLRTEGNPERARELLMRLRKAADASRADELYATHRLIDLYLGPLNDEGRAMSELRRLTERFPGTRDADGAQAELDRRRAQRKIDHQDHH